MQEELDKEIADALGDQSIEDLMDSDTAAATPPAPRMSAAAKAAEGSDDDSDDDGPSIEPSNTRRGTIAGVRGDDVFVELGPKEQGVCPTTAFKGKVPRVGEHLDFIVETFLEDEQLFKLTLPGETSKAEWKNLQKGMVVEGMVIGMNTGGLEVKIAGKRAFMPMSQVDLNRIEDFAPFLNRKIKVKVLELDRKKKRLLVSRRAVLEEEAKEERKKLAATIQSDEVREGIVRRLEPFGAFVELVPGVDGLLHVSDLAHHRVNDPKDMLEIGQKVTVKVLKVQKGGQRISLGLKQLVESPWRTADQRYVVGETVRGTVTRAMEFGAFVQLEPGVEGLIHISQLSDKRVDRVEQAVRVGKEVEAKIMEVDPKRQRIGLSIKALLVPEEMARPEEASRDEIRQYTKSAKQAKAMESLMSKFGGGDGLKGGIG
ncbi:MAG: S1 RNA-binding domain-containing protein [Phycisphaera sp.]|nr:S1 RNA-binding domain-containing protein [Phycisphaera sp.]